MCFGGGDSSPPPPPVVNAAPASPTRSDQENKAAVANNIADIRRRQGLTSTALTGGLGDSSYGQNARQTLLGGR